MPDGFDAALRLLPERIRRGAPRGTARGETEEFRLRCGRPPTAVVGDREKPMDEAPVTAEELRRVLDAATQSSFHAAAEQLRRGFLAAGDGVRVGVCGTAGLDAGGVRTLRDISSLAIRIPRQVFGAGRELLPALETGSVLILSPPGGGKTTLLRELVRMFSERGERAGVADERGELAAVRNGVPGFDLGPCTDVVTGAPKAEAAMLLLRAMNPRLVAMDELSEPADCAAAAALRGCGVRVFATVHAAAPEELREKSFLPPGLFTRAVVIERRGGVRRYRVERL